MPSDSDAAAIAASLDDPGCFGEVFDRHATVTNSTSFDSYGPTACCPTTRPIPLSSLERRSD
jgi:hypothetical protein